MYTYNCEVVRVVDGDTIDVNIDLGFGVWLKNERVRLENIDTPEVRTKDFDEKVCGLLAKARVSELTKASNIKLVSSAFKGSFGRILGDFIINDVKLTDTLLNEHLAAIYTGKTKEEIQEQHLYNRQILINEGRIILTES